MAITFRHLVRKPSGAAEIAGRGIRVYTILGLHQSGDAPEEIAKAYDLPMGAVYEALAYAADHSEEIEAIRRAEAEIEREHLSRIPEAIRRGIDIP